MFHARIPHPASRSSNGWTRGRAGGSLRAAALLALLLCAGVASCGDEPTGASDGGTLFDLRSVDDRSLPWVKPPGVSTGVTIRIDHGRLLLRGDGTFTLMVAGSALSTYSVSGTYRAAGNDLRLTYLSTYLGEAISGEADGERRADSVIFTHEGLEPHRWVYVRTAYPSPAIREGLFILSAIDGRGPPLVSHDTVIGGTRYVGQVLYDSITYSDGVFFRRVRESRSVAYLAHGDSLVGGEFYHGFGTYEGSDDYLILRHYFPGDYYPPRDSLIIGTETLTRQTRLIRGVYEERYTRRR